MVNSEQLVERLSVAASAAYAWVRDPLRSTRLPQYTANLQKDTPPSVVATADHVDAEWIAAFRAHQEPIASDVSIVCVTQRPHFAGRLALNVTRQTHGEVELIVVQHGCELSDDDRRSHRSLRSATLLSIDERSTLGDGLNAGLAAATGRFVAKFDDDDHYGPEYLADALRCASFAQAGVLGKRTYYWTSETTGALAVRFPGREYRYVASLAGGTLMIDRERFSNPSFPSVSIGEDQALVRAALRSGTSVFATDRFNYVQARGDWNTWAVPESELMADSIGLGEQPPYAAFV